MTITCLQTQSTVFPRAGADGNFSVRITSINSGSREINVASLEKFKDY